QAEDGIRDDLVTGVQTCALPIFDRVRNLVKESGPESQVAFGEPKSNLSQEEFCERVGRAKEYIQSGDIFQVVLSRRYKIPFKGRSEERRVGKGSRARKCVDQKDQ